MTAGKLTRVNFIARTTKLALDILQNTWYDVVEIGKHLACGLETSAAVNPNTRTTKLKKLVVDKRENV